MAILRQFTDLKKSVKTSKIDKLKAELKELQERLKIFKAGTDHNSKFYRENIFKYEQPCRDKGVELFHATGLYKYIDWYSLCNV